MRGRRRRERRIGRARRATTPAMNTIPYLAFGALALIGAALAIARPARTALPLYAATLPIASVIKLSVPLPSPFDTLSSLLGGLTIVALLGHLAIYQRGRLPGLAMGAWTLLLAWSILTVVWAIDPSTAASTARVAISLVVLLALCSVARFDRGDLEMLRLAVIVSGIVVGLYATYLLLKGAALPTHGASQRFSIATNPSDTDPNILAASLLMPMLLSVERILLGGALWWRAVVWRVIGVAGAFFSTLAIVITGSRGGLLAALVGFVIVLVSCRRLPDARRMVRRVTVAIIASLAAVVVITATGTAVAPGGTVARLTSSDAFRRIFAVQNGSSGRFDIWKAGALACEAYCGVGAGLGNFPDAYNRAFLFSGAAKNVGANRPAHNIYLEMAVDAGVPGLTLLLLALIAEWMALGRRAVRDVAPALKGVVVAILIANIFLSAIWFKYFFLVFVLLRVAEGAAEQWTALRAETVPAIGFARGTAAASVHQDHHAALDVRSHA